MNRAATPLLWALIPLAAGIIVASYVFLPLWLSAGGLLLCLLLAWRWDSTPLTIAAIFLFGISSYNLRHDILHQSVDDLRMRPANALHRGAAERLDRLDLPEDGQAVVNAMVAGDKTGISYELRSAYARSGTSHLLAVSGLHVGIVFMLANFLLRWLLLAPNGHRWRNGVVILLVWIYAAIANFPPSVIRAAFMFSVLQFSLASSSAYVSLNTLAAAAFMMLIVNPLFLFSLSFQLSFIAVAGIILWAVPAARWLHGPWAIGNALLGIAGVGIAATVATAPLIAHTFGQISVIGVPLNPIVIAIANVIVGVGAVWMILPFLPGVPWLLDTATATQNNLVQWAAALPNAVVKIQISALACWAAYAVMILVTYGIARIRVAR